MKALVLYDSVFGNTANVAKTINEELLKIGDSEVRDANSFKVSDMNDVDIFVVGSPTRAFNPTPKIKKLLKGLAKAENTNTRFLVFDTRLNVVEINNGFLNFMVGIFGYAAEKLSKILIKKGYQPAGKCEVFYVKESEGPLKDGELAKARNWVTRNLK